MKKFLLFILYLVVAILIVMAPPLYVFTVTGEFKWSFSDHIKVLDKDQLWGTAYFGHDAEYKFYMTEYLQPEILVLGTSRSMKISEKSFNPDFSFYNAGVSVQNIRDYYTFVHKLNYNPKLIVVDINQFWFNANRKPAHEAHYDWPTFDLALLISNCFNFYEDLLVGKIHIGDLHKNSNLGILGRFRNDGFTKTGCHYYGSYLNNPNAPDYNFHDTYSRIENHNRRFEKCDTLDRSVIVYIEKFLEECKQRDIKVLAVISIFAPKVYDKMEKDGNYYPLLHEIYDALVPLFDFETTYLYDYTDVTSLGALDKDFVDGYHPAEPVHFLTHKDILLKHNVLNDFFVTPQQLDSLYGDYQRKGISYHNFD